LTDASLRVSWRLWPNAEQLTRAVWTRRRRRWKVEDGAVMRSAQPTIEPPEKFLDGLQARHSLVFDRGQDGSADQDLSPRVALAFSLTGTCEQPALLTSQPRQTLFERVNPASYFF